ncbi:MAG TPA: L,D-transpeptidase family protein [Pseudobacteroides sp.]|uniref:L,D-transpeptidase family protein n=1 Tax=Pseudobacteroides sp. TaxID=1968840 RepID=UPI002F953213
MRSIIKRLTFIIPVSLLVVILLGFSPYYVTTGSTGEVARDRGYSSIFIGNNPKYSDSKNGTQINIKPDEYLIKKDDSLLSISKNYKITPSELKWINKPNLKVEKGNIIKIPVIEKKSLRDIINAKGIDINVAPLEIRVNKTDHVLGVFSNGILLKSYHMEIGDNGLNDKEVVGDHKTPEGTFYITEKSVLSPEDYYLGSRWMRLSYPNVEDAERGLQNGIINNGTYNKIKNAINNLETPPQETDLGGSVGIHGGSKETFGSNWTWGCVGLKNSDIEDFFDFINIGAKVMIER